ncbi:MAG: sulfatase-like hydrolase/transferase [Sedimentisphaerales bacterium]|nr:sulfatase-like hydrolase/transferase [Sedimentisphaerales bacterium]
MLNRRDFLKATGVWTAAISLVGCAEFSTGKKGNRKPNIVIIMADDMGFSDIGCYGGEIQTPSLDKLAVNGLRFTQFYNTGRCCPTRASLLTGLYPHQSGIGDMSGDDGLPGYKGRLNEQCITIAEVLRPAGYRNYAAGKWHVGPGPEHWPLQRGFDHYYGANSASGHYFGLQARNGRRFIIDDQEYIPEGQARKTGQTGYWPFQNKDGTPWYGTDAYTDYALSYLEEHAEEHTDRPFFLYVAYTAPHWPLHALPEDIAKYQGRYMKGWDQLRKERYARQLQMGIVHSDWSISPRDPEAPAWEGLTEEQKQEMDLRMAVYAAMVDRMDQNIGRLIAKLKSLGQFENTLILFLSDNGGCHEGGPWGFSRGKKDSPAGSPDSYTSYGRCWANASNTPFRMFKHWVHEGGVSTPLIAHWPGVVNDKGTLTDQTGHVVDLMATCCDAAGVSYPKSYNGQTITPLEGRSLIPVFKGQQREGHAMIFWEHEGNRAVRQGDWKLVSRFPDNKWELYNVKVDRSELNDISQQHPDRVNELKAAYLEWAVRCNVIPYGKLQQHRRAK